MRPAAAQIRKWREDPRTFVREALRVTPDAWQDDVLYAFATKQRIALKSSKGPGKLQPKSMLVPTPSGIRPWGSIRPGDLLFAEDGSPTEVQGIHDNGLVPIYRVYFDDGSHTDAGAEHLWRVRGATERRHDEWAVLTTQQIVERGVRVKNGRWASRQFEIPRQGPAEFPAVELPLDPYVLGVWLGDGTAGAGHYTKPDVQIEEEIQRRGLETSRTAHGRVTVGGLTQALRALQLFGLHSCERHIPSEYLTAGPEQRLDVLRGLMDTDGCIGKDNHCEYGSTSRALAEGAMWLVRSLGGVATLKETVKQGWYTDETGERVPCRDCYRVTVTMPVNPFTLERKAERWHEPQARYLTRYIDRIEDHGTADSMCVTIAHPSRCYLANDFIVTHNSTVLSWCGWNFLATRPEPKVAATSITGANLSDGLWTEMSKWQGRSPFLKQTFQWTATRISSKERPETWWASARQWSHGADATQQADTLAGLHSEYLLFLIDEAGGVPDAVMAAAEAGLSTGTECKLLIAGNPTQTQGPLWRACTTERALWWVYEISGDPDDPKRAPRISIKWAREQIEKYGRDSPWVLVNVFGKFPPGQSNTLIGADVASAAAKLSMQEAAYCYEPRVLGVDVARYGDDATVLAPRQGRVCFKLREFRNLSTMETCGQVALLIEKWGPDAVFVDETGLGAGVVDRLRELGHPVIGVEFGGKPVRPEPKCLNRRAEMWWQMGDWLKRGGAIPDDGELVSELTGPTYKYDSQGRCVLEAKDDMKKRGLPSPNRADALALTFAAPVARRPAWAALPGAAAWHQRQQVDFEPYASASRSADFDPYSNGSH